MPILTKNHIGIELAILNTPISATNKSDRHDITEILSEVALNTITLTPLQQ